MMKPILATMSLVLLAATLNAQGDWAGFGRYAAANIDAPRGAQAVFMGNSIFEGWMHTQSECFADNDYICRAISGQTTSQMLVRFRADVFQLEPRCVVILAGTNDIAGYNGDISLENIARNIASMAELARCNGLKVVICSVLPAYDYGWSPGREPAPKIIELNRMLKDYAERNDCLYADIHTAMKYGRDGLPLGWTTDEVHLTAEGYTKMAGILKPVIDRTLR